MVRATGMQSDDVLQWPASPTWVVAEAPDLRGRRMDSARTYADMADAELLALSAGGDRCAFDAVVIRHGPYAFRVAVRMVPNRAVAEDLVQEAMVRAWSQAKRFDPGRANFTTWLYRIVVNLCIDERRRTQPEPMPEEFDAPDGAAPPDEAMEAAECNARLTMALQELPVGQRAAVTLVYDEGLSGAEAGRVLGVSAKAVERLLARARATLRGRLLVEPDGMETSLC
jgi:RNA polymerase sigma-70 factor (ECF subfamily)